MNASGQLSITLVLGIFFAFSSAARVQEKKPDDKKPADLAQEVAAAREKGLDWLVKHQADDGSWGKSYTVGITGIGCLAFLSSSDEPFTGPRGKALTRGLQFLLANQKDGMFLTQGQSVRTWIHNQGFASLALSEAYGRSLFCKVKPDIDVKKMREVVARSVKAIAANQSHSGGWWYSPGALDRDEGATTVCAVQALVSAANFGLDIDPKVLDKGFEYLKKSQNKDGSFNYIQGDGTSMKGGTAADVATLGLMQKFDFDVMMKGYKFLLEFTPAGMSAPHQPYFFPYYGHYYGTMGMLLLGQEYKDDKTFRTNTARYIAQTQAALIAWQQPDGGWQNKGWIQDHEKTENNGYATTFATLTLFVPEARLSVYNRVPPKLPQPATQDVHNFVKQKWYEGMPYREVRRRFTSADLKDLYAILSDSDYRPHWPAAAQMIGYLGKAQGSAAALFEYVRKADDYRGLDRAAGYRRVQGKVLALMWLGLVGGDDAQAALRACLTEEGATAMGKNWLGTLPEPLARDRDRFVSMIREQAACGLILARSAEGIALVEKLYRAEDAMCREKKIVTDLYSGLTTAMAMRDLIAARGLDGYLNLQGEGPASLEAMGPYLRRYGWHLDKADTGREAKNRF